MSRLLTLYLLTGIPPPAGISQLTGKYWGLVWPRQRETRGVLLFAEPWWSDDMGQGGKVGGDGGDLLLTKERSETWGMRTVIRVTRMRVRENDIQCFSEDNRQRAPGDWWHGPHSCHMLSLSRYRVLLHQNCESSMDRNISLPDIVHRVFFAHSCCNVQEIRILCSENQPM